MSASNTATNAKLQLLDLIENQASDDLLRDMLNFAASEIMEMEVSAKAGAHLGERLADGRQAHRNGHRARSWETRAGTIDLAIPRLRTGSYFPSFLHQRIPNWPRLWPTAWNRSWPTWTFQSSTGPNCIRQTRWND